ncbi:MAG: type II toxin-antitoxin system VapC family toxin [Bacteroidota bacterium]
MENRGLILCDTNIIIEFYKGNIQVVEYLRVIGQEKIAISSITAAELLYGALNKVELRQISKDLQLLAVIHVDKEISKKSLELMEKYVLSHKLKLPDALIAASALVYDMTLYTLNLKDFRFIKEVKLVQ